MPFRNRKTGKEKIIPQRFKYMLKNERVKWYQANLRAECGAKSWFKAEEAINFLKAEGFVITFSEFKDLAMRLYQKDERGTFCDLEVIGFIGRLSLDEEIQKDLQIVFNYFNPVNGFITAQQLKKGLTSLGEKLSDKQIDRIFYDLDLNCRGFINFEQFIEAMTSL